MGINRIRVSVVSLLGSLFTAAGTLPYGAWAQSAQPLGITPDTMEECELLIVGGGLSGVSAAYESLQMGRTVCMTELTDWMGGQLTSQGTSALDEVRQQRALLYYPKGYLEFRQLIEQHYGRLNPGDCWVSLSCFFPDDAETILQDMLNNAARRGRGTLKWFPSTIIKELEYNAEGNQIVGAIAIQHSPAPGTPPLNTEPLSAFIEDAYSYDDSARLTKTVIQFAPQPIRNRDGSTTLPDPAPWYMIEATETGELIALADVPYRVGLDARSPVNPSSASATGDPYCTQGFTYTFAMERTEEALEHEQPPFYERYRPYYGYDPNPRLADIDVVFTYRRLWSPEPRESDRVFGVTRPKPGDISMQNWVWGNDYRPGTAADNLIFTREQLQALGQLEPGGWLGGLRTETLQAGEELALGFFYWIVADDTDSQLGEGVKEPHPNHRLLTGLESPMGTEHGLSKFPYIREGRRIIGRPAYGYSQGFAINEIDISWVDYNQEFYQTNLVPRDYQTLWYGLAGLETTSAIRNQTPPDQIQRRTRSAIFPDAVGIAQYAIDFHPCMEFSPAEAPGNVERVDSRQAHGRAYPGQIPLSAMIPQRLDNLLVAGKSIATSHIAAAAYRVHSFEWSAGAAAGTTASFALSEGLMPYQLIDNLPRMEPKLMELQALLRRNGNPTEFPDTSIFNEEWEEWAPW
ncbi:MAG: FAD-dependent oxidoreductase [Kaiparowitsia implicata GSE-PSE-MK54-09C]|nr:FAD-dependent oxidoreductase [Kaiparowitsia implicata GSE-PSE-MK54-09C]